MARLSWLPFTDDWRQARHARAERAWADALLQHRNGDVTAAGRMLAALRAGAEPTLAKAKQALDPPAPEVLQRLLKANPNLHPLADLPATDQFGDTLLHRWARIPERSEPQHARITRLLLTPTTPEQVAKLVSWNVSGNLLRKNQEQQDPQMLAALHGNWALLKGLAQHLKASAGGMQTDMRQRHWVDHWTDGVLERHAAGQPLRLTDADPALSALKVCLGPEEGALLGRKNGWYGAPVARLLAAGVDWRLAEHLFPSRPDANPADRSETSLGSREGPVDPAHFRAYSALAEALSPNATVQGPGIDSHYLAGAMVSSQPMEALEWIMEGMSHFRADPREMPRQCNVWVTGQRIGSAAYPWLAKPERLAVALERRWLEPTGLLPDNLPELPTLLIDMMSDPAREPMARRILDALQRNYPPVMDAGYKSILMADRLENTLKAPAPGTTSARQRL